MPTDGGRGIVVARRCANQRAAVSANSAILRFSTDKHELDIDAIFDFLHRDAYWCRGIPRDVVERAIEGSLCFDAYVGDRFVGFARLVTDYATFAYLCDVFVLPAERGNGYGRALIDHIFAQPMLQRLRRIMLATTDAHELYRPVGFAAPGNPERLMEIRRPDIYTKR